VARFSRAGARRYVLDSNALVGLFEDRAVIAEKVERLLRDALLRELPLLMSVANWGEVFYTEWRYRGEAQGPRSRSEGAGVAPRFHRRRSGSGHARGAPPTKTQPRLRRRIRRERGAGPVTADPEF
jgi:predicted nucleic acid-binding protein